MFLFCFHSSPNPAHSGADLCHRFLALLPCQCKVWRHKCLTRTSADRNPQERHSWAMEHMKTRLPTQVFGSTDCDPQSEEQTGCAPSRRLLSSQNTGQAHNAHWDSSIPPKPAETLGSGSKNSFDPSNHCPSFMLAFNTCHLPG